MKNPRVKRTPLAARKQRPPQGLRAALQDLSPVQFNAFQAMLEETITLQEMTDRAASEFGIKTSSAAIGDYYHRRGKEVWMEQAGEQTTLTLAGFELLITCPRPGVVSILAQERAPREIASPSDEPTGSPE